MIVLFQVYSVSAFEPSPSCDYLNFAKHVFFTGTYKLKNDMIVKCQYYKENLNQNDVKLARKSLMISDELSFDSPSEGFKFKKINSNQNSVNYWDMAGTSMDWTMNTGVDTGPLGSEVVISFGEPNRLFMIWGISFHKEQFEERNPDGISLKIAYSNYMDIENEAYNLGDYRNPTATENGKYTIAINPSDLDEQGCFYFKEPDGSPLILVASVISLDLAKGKLNFDMIGTNVDFVGMAKGKMANNKNYNYYSAPIERFWIKGYEYFLNLN